ncbi:MAG: formylglycine-generating enzyme family protein [Planctomycetota bacterium]
MRTRLLAGIVAALISVCGWGEEMKAPSGCVPTADAKAGTGGYADRVVHEKTGIQFVLIAPAAFTMGSRKISTSSLPPHEVTIPKAFYIGKTEVTNAQYRKFVDATGYDGKGETDPAYDLYLRHWRGVSLMSKEDDYPIVWVSWKNAKAFCEWAGLSLPSEAQWEYACRAGTTTLYYSGDDQKGFDEIGWGLTNSDALTHPVGRKKPNAWGLYDMLGNVWEWCEDDYVYKYDGAPTDGSARIENPRTLTRALRGGSWSNSTGPTTNSSASRFNSAPGNASNDVGFRVVLTPP